MTIKHLALATILLVVVGLTAFRLGAQQGTTPVATRYTIVQGEYLYIPPKPPNLNERGIFRIDMVTGKTWRFVFRDSSTYWDPIDEPGEQRRPN